MEGCGGKSKSIWPVHGGAGRGGRRGESTTPGGAAGSGCGSGGGALSLCPGLILMFIEEARSYRTQLRNHNGAGRKQLCSLATLSTHLQNALQLRQPAPYRRPWLPAAIAFAQPCQHPFESVLPSVPASSPSLGLPSPSAVRSPISFASLLPLLVFSHS